MLRDYHLEGLDAAADASRIEWWSAVCIRVPQKFRKGFDSLVLLIVWALWKETNNRVFNDPWRQLMILAERSPRR